MSMTEQGGEALYQVAMHALCESNAKRGDPDLRFTPSPSALEGIAGHTLVTSQRPIHYQHEVALNGRCRHLQMHGRANGYDPQTNCLEEIKTHCGDLALRPANHRHLHWVQAGVCDWPFCAERKLEEIELVLVYLEVGGQKETHFVRWVRADELWLFFESQRQAPLTWAEQGLTHRRRRDRELATLHFPHTKFRRGQRQLAEAVYKAVSAGCCLMAQVPTGIGKTTGTLFPQLKTTPGQCLDRLFFLAAKTPSRALTLHALRSLGGGTGGLPVRVLELMVRDKACEHSGKACHSESCPLAQDFYERLPTARIATVEAHWLDQARLRRVALTHRVYPYYLNQELARWCDLVVGDYNYRSDLGAMLHGLTQANQWRMAVLVDKTHNLVERGRRVYSTELDQGDFLGVRKTAPEALRKSLRRIQRAWNELGKTQADDYQAYNEPPQRLLLALQNAMATINDLLTEQPQALGPALQEFYFVILQFGHLAELFGKHSLFDIEKRPGRNGRSLARLCLRNMMPAAFLVGRFATGRSTVLFPVTLGPRDYYADLLSLPAGTPQLETDLPFSAEQLEVHVQRRASMRCAQRQASLVPTAAILGEQLRQQPGNYLVSSDSFDYLQQMLDVFRQTYPWVPCWNQTRRTDEAERRAFLERLVAGGEDIGFAVLGGAFDEDVDLPRERLIGAFIATFGLPQMSPVNEQTRLRMQRLFGDGYDYTYLYPGPQRMARAAGRVIRSRSDRGVVHLIDDHFAQARVRRLLPSWW